MKFRLHSGSTKILSGAFVLLFTVATVLQAFYCYKRPFATLDTMVYVSLLDGGTLSEFQQAGATCAAQLPGPHTGCILARDQAFIEVTHYSAADYATFSRFYTVKPLYLWTLQAVHHLFHLNAYTTLRAVSAFSYLVIAAVLAFWLGRHLSIPAACVTAFLIANYAPVLALGKNLLPDGFSNALMLPVLLLILYVPCSLSLQLALLAVLPLARPDNILFCAILGALLIYRTLSSRNLKLLRLTLLVFCVILLNTLLQHLGHALPFAVLFHHSFLTWTPPITYPDLHLSAREYLHTVLADGFKTIALDFPLPLFLTVLALADPKGWRPLRDLVFVAAFTSFVRLLLFPNMEERYYTWYLILAALGAVITLSQRLHLSGSWLVRQAEAAHQFKS